jgi:hypothetical protein
MKHTPGKLNKWVTAGLHYILDEKGRFIFWACGLADGIDNEARREELAANSDRLVELWNSGLDPAGVQAVVECLRWTLQVIDREKYSILVEKCEAALAGIKEE